MANPMKSAASKERLRKLHLNNVKPDAAFNSALGNYKSHARHRDQAFSLSRKAAKRLFGSLCYYCGAPPSNETVADSGASFMYNGIDRLNSNRGYVTDNCVPCCKICNWMKQRLSLCAFLCHIRRIAKHTRRL